MAASSPAAFKSAEQLALEQLLSSVVPPQPPQAPPPPSPELIRHIVNGLNKPTTPKVTPDSASVLGHRG